MTYRPNFREISLILNTAISTAKIKTLKTPYADIRPQMHCILCGDIGSLKSTLLKNISIELKSPMQFNLSSAQLMGSVDKTTGITNLPAVWDCRNSVLCIDEYNCEKQGMTHTATQTLLPLLETPKLMKRTGYRTNNIKEVDDDLSLIIEDGKIMINTRFVMIATTMMAIHKKQRMIELEALRTRCVVLPYYPSIDDIRKRMNNTLEYKCIQHKVNPHIKINKKVYSMIDKLIMERKIEPKFYARTFGDLCRAYAVKKDFNEVADVILNLRQITTE